VRALERGARESFPARHAFTNCVSIAGNGNDAALGSGVRSTMGLK
jgi:hypothetical protein